jgi:hypothetical protein
VFAHHASVDAVALLRDGRTLATASDDKTVWLVSLPSSDIFEFIDYERMDFRLAGQSCRKANAKRRFYCQCQPTSNLTWSCEWPIDRAARDGAQGAYPQFAPEVILSVGVGF